MWDRFEAEGVTVVAIVVDPDENNRAMVDKLLLPFPILSDPEGRVIREWDVLNPAEHDIAKPAISASGATAASPIDTWGPITPTGPPMKSSSRA